MVCIKQLTSGIKHLTSGIKQLTIGIKQLTIGGRDGIGYAWQRNFGLGIGQFIVGVAAG
jgi:X-X-X-Leu-X-X-Gly heptad repeat protein